MIILGILYTHVTEFGKLIMVATGIEKKTLFYLHTGLIDDRFQTQP